MNKYKGINPEIAFPPSRAPELVNGAFNGGIVLNISPMMIGLNQSPALDTVRIEKGGMRQDYDVETLGAASATLIRALGEYRRIESGASTYEAFFRLYTESQTSNDVRIDRWDGSVWNREVTDTLELDRVLISWISALDAVFFADGTKVLKWARGVTYTDQDDSFGAGNSLTAVNDSTNATINPGDASEDKYNVHFNMSITGPSSSGAVTIRVLDGAANVLKDTEYDIPDSTNTSRSLDYDHESIPVVGDITAGGTLKLELEAIQNPGVTRTNELLEDTDTQFTGSKDPDREAATDEYKYIYSIGGRSESSCDVEFWMNDGGGWTLEHTLTNQGPGTGQYYYVTKNEMGVGSEFRIIINNITPGPMWITEAEVQWTEGFEIEVHGFEDPAAGDEDYGVTYQTEGEISNTFTQVDNGDTAPADITARYLGYFANRVIALQYDSGGGTIDPQKVGWSVSGDDADWVGDGSGETILESRSDPIDKLMALKPFSSNIAALFRERSIMRVTATGRLEPALAFFPWIEQLGTESPFSCEVVPGGVMFLGHDRMVYYLSESGVVPVGEAIQSEFYKTVGDLHSVEGTYDPISQDYILAVPAESGESTAVAWFFDMDRFARTREKVWFKTTQTMDRVSIIQGEDIVWTERSNVYRYDRDSVTNGGYWVSPTLNRKKRMGEYSLFRVILRYETEYSIGWAGLQPRIYIQGSGDGGVTWKDGYQSYLDLDSTSGGTLRVVQGFNITGSDLRFRVQIANIGSFKIYLKEWQAEIIDRGSLESDHE